MDSSPIYVFKAMRFSAVILSSQFNNLNFWFTGEETKLKRHYRVLKEKDVFQSCCKQCKSRAQERGEGVKKREYKGGKSSGKEDGEGKWRMHL